MGGGYLARGTAFLSARGLVHFDAHFDNLLTDRQRIYFADLGLTLSRDFELSPEEAAFLTGHLGYDRAYAPARLLRHHLLDRLRDGTPHGDFPRARARGDARARVPPQIAELVDRQAETALVMDDFPHRLPTRSRRTPFPAARPRQALTASRGV
ncbi:hypothetical protein ABZZ79_10325 [Streptomyces sp. NPDC006458]|uniref:hypothetical protein n=1 Tax=Streptomyces sp. NPDC006458 TaxID=3154302 RepID=UPI0033A1A99A